MVILTKKIITKVSVIIATGAFTFLAGMQNVSAQVLFCDVFPCSEKKKTTYIEDSWSTWFAFITGLIFVSFITLGVVIVIKGAVKILRSEGDSGKIQEGMKAMKGVYIGLGLVIGGIIGLLVVLALFNADSIFNNDVPEPEGVTIPDGLRDTVL